MEDEHHMKEEHQIGEEMEEHPYVGAPYRYPHMYE